jgi:hypothetical protein
MLINLLEERTDIFLGIRFWGMSPTSMENCSKSIEREQNTRIQNCILVKQFQNGSKDVTPDKISGSKNLELAKIWMGWSN